MDIINLVPYIQEWIFLHHDILPYDLIVWEKIPEEADKKYQHATLADVSYDFGVAWKLAALSKKHKRILVISETLNAMYLLPWLSTLPADTNVTVLQVGAGISGYMSKNWPDMTDITTLLPYAHILEVYDRDSLTSALQQSGKNYIRITYGDTPVTMFEKALPIDAGIADLRDRWFEGIAGTIIAPWGNLINTIHAVQHLQEEGKSFDLFVLLDYDFSIGSALKESIIKTENIIMILDQNRRTAYESIIKAKLWDSGLVDTNIYFVYPNAEKINTILPEYLREQANRDGLGIAEKINSLH